MKLKGVLEPEDAAQAADVPERLWLTEDDLAAELQLTADDVRQLYDTKMIPGFKVGGKLRFVAAAVTEALATRDVGRSPEERAVEELLRCPGYVPNPDQSLECLNCGVLKHEHE